MGKPLQTVLLALACGVAGCSHALEPDGAYTRRLVLYGALTTRTDTQYVRLSWTSLSGEASDDVVGAMVKLSCDGSTSLFRDTTVESLDGSGMRRTYHAYVLYGLALKPLAAYELTAVAPTGETASAKAVAHAPVIVGIENPWVFHRGSDIEPIWILATFGHTTGAYTCRLYVDYENLVDGLWKAGRIEVPYRIARKDDWSSMPPQALDPDQSDRQFRIAFDLDNFFVARSRAFGDIPVNRTIRVVIEVTQLDEPLFRYWYRDFGPLSASTVRLDRPDYTNIQNGLGVFGCMRTSTYEVKY